MWKWVVSNEHICNRLCARYACAWVCVFNSLGLASVKLSICRARQYTNNTHIISSTRYKMLSLLLPFIFKLAPFVASSSWMCQSVCVWIKCTYFFCLPKWNESTKFISCDVYVVLMHSFFIIQCLIWLHANESNNNINKHITHREREWECARSHEWMCQWWGRKLKEDVH